MALLLFASARPMARVTLPADYMTLIMAMDVSRSMLAEDVEPSRIKAAQKAAKEFLQDLPKNVRVGIVSFAGNAQVVQHVSQDKDELVAAIDRFQLQRGTATGSGLLLALSTLRPEAQIDLEAALYNTNPFGYSDQGKSGGAKSLDAKPVAKAPTRVAPSFYSRMDAARRALIPCWLPRGPLIWVCVSTPLVLAHRMALFRATRAIHFSPKWMKNL
jgi:Ca-activated chloride channel family protein